MEAIITPNPPVFLRKLVSRSRAIRDKLRDEYAELLLNALMLISTLDIRDKNGNIIESGSSLIDKVLTLERRGRDITVEIDILGKDKWLQLKKIWARLREIENQDHFLISGR